MYVILTYDVGVKRVAKVRKTCLRYLCWVQNSVFEGMITEAQLKRLKKNLESLIDVENDTIRIYRMQSLKYSSLEQIGNSIVNDFII